MQTQHTKRLFVAVHVKADQALIELVNMLKKALSYQRIGWVKLDNMHLTIKFMGDTPQYKIASISEALKVVAERHKPIVYNLTKCGIFGSRYDPRIIWLGAQQHPDAIIQFGKDVINSMHDLGFERDRQNFVPHLTIGRIKQLSDKNHFHEIMRSITEKDYQLLNVKEFTLYESVLKPTGPVYTILKQFPLSND